jgi:hypothetical protein
LWKLFQTRVARGARRGVPRVMIQGVTVRAQKVDRMARRRKRSEKKASGRKRGKEKRKIPDKKHSKRPAGNGDAIENRNDK